MFTATELKYEPKPKHCMYSVKDLMKVSFSPAENSMPKPQRARRRAAYRHPTRHQWSFLARGQPAPRHSMLSPCSQPDMKLESQSLRKSSHVLLSARRAFYGDRDDRRRRFSIANNLSQLTSRGAAKRRGCHDMIRKLCKVGFGSCLSSRQITNCRTTSVARHIFTEKK